MYSRRVGNEQEDHRQHCRAEGLPDVAVDSANTAYAVWQDSRRRQSRHLLLEPGQRRDELGDAERQDH